MVNISSRYIKHYLYVDNLMIDGLGASEIYMNNELDQIVAINNKGIMRAISKSEYLREKGWLENIHATMPIMSHDPRGVSIDDLVGDKTKLLEKLRYIQAKKTHVVIKIPFTYKFIKLWQKKS